MATINNIRKRSGLVIAIIGIAILGFLISDAIQNNSSLLRGSNKEIVGEIDGEEIPRALFDQRVKQAEANYKQQSRVSSLDAQQRVQINKQAWDRLVVERTLEEELDALGVEVSGEEVWYIMQGKAEPHPFIAQNFRDPETNQFSRARLQEFVANLSQQRPEDRQAWAQIEDAILVSRREEKYTNLVANSAYVTNLEARYNYLAKNKMATIKYVALKSSDVADSVSVTDEEILEYARSKGDVYEQDNARSMQVVKFEYFPSSEDTTEIRQEVQNIKSEFKSKKGEEAWSYARLKSEESVNEDFVAPNRIPVDVETQLLSAKKGTVFGPINDGGSLKLIKLVDTKEEGEQWYRASEILIRVTGETDEDTAEAVQETRDILAKITSGEEDFSTMARKHNTGAKAANGGDIGWFKEGTKDQKIEKGIAKRDSGDVFMVQTSKGAHIIEVTRKPTTKKYAVAEIVKTIQPSERTINLAFNQAKDFLYAASDAQSFVDIVAKEGYDVTKVDAIGPMESNIAGLGEATDLRRWAFKQDQVDVVTDDVYQVDNAYAVALLTEIQVEGEIDLDEHRNTIRDELVKQKKAKMQFEKLKEAYTEDLEALASAVGVEVQTSTGARLEVPLVEGLGNEPKFIGTVFALEEGQVSDVILGENGAYVVQLESFSEVALPNNFSSYKRSQNLIDSKRNQMQVAVYDALIEMANPVDNRYLYY